MHAKVMTFAAAIVLLAIVALIPTLQFPSAEEVSTFVGPRLWPLCLLIALLVLGSFLLVTTWRSSHSETANKREDSTTDSTNSEASTPARSGAASHHWWLMLGTVAYTLLMQATGYLLATVVFTLFCTLLLGARYWGAILATIVVAAVLIQGVFSYLLGIPLP